MSNSEQADCAWRLLRLLCDEETDEEEEPSRSDTVALDTTAPLPEEISLPMSKKRKVQATAKTLNQTSTQNLFLYR